MAAPKFVKQRPTEVVTSSAALTAAVVAGTQGAWVAAAVLAGIAVLTPLVTWLNRKAQG